MKRSEIMVVAGLLVLVAGLLYYGSVLNKKEIAELETADSYVAADSCITHEGLGMHIHPVLSISILGENVLIPNEIGIDQSCMKAVHTHDDTGTVHLEFPVVRDFYLKDFFHVWSKDFSRESLLGYTVDENTEIVVKVNGEIVDTYEDTLLRDKDQISIEYRLK